MTTEHSPISLLRAQAERIASILKAAERGETVAGDPAGKIAAARSADVVKVGVVMDDKIITITMPWVTIRETSEAGIVEYIVNQMRGERATIQ